MYRLTLQLIFSVDQLQISILSSVYEKEDILQINRNENYISVCNFMHSIQGAKTTQLN